MTPRAIGVSAGAGRRRWCSPGCESTCALPPWACGDRGDQREAEPGAAGGAGARGVAAGEPLERACRRGPRAGPGPSSCTAIRTQPSAAARRDGHRRAGWRVVARVAEQVGDHLVQPLLVAGDGHRLVGEVELPAVRRARRRVRRRPTRAAAGSGRPRRAPAAGRRRGGRAAAGPRRGRTSGRPRSRPWSARSTRAAGSSGVRRESSAYPWIVDSGVRSSWEASADELADLLLAAVPGRRARSRRARAACSARRRPGRPRSARR